MFAQVSTTVVDQPGWGAAEWIAIIGGVTTVVGALTTLIIAITKLRRENRAQHADNKAASEARFDELRSDLHDVGRTVVRIDEKVDRLDGRVDMLDGRLDRHESLFHRGRRRW